MLKVPELRPQDVGTPVPVDAKVPVDTYTYDYIIVGGGTAGSVLASRLSEDPSVSVLVIEQGPGADTWASRVPVISGNPFRSGTLAAMWWALPMPQVDGRALQVMRGEALGGTSRINALLYTRGVPGEYNRWAELGCEGWGYTDLEPYFIISEKTLSHPASKFRGKKGPWVNRQFSTSPYKIMKPVTDAICGANIARVDDLNDPATPAAALGALDVIIDGDSRRTSTNRAFLPAKLTSDRAARLKICTNSLVLRLDVAREVDGALRARGVYFEATNPRSAAQTFYAQARREIVLSAGALGSPQILMLSGIGPKEHLEHKDVPVLLDVPAVGSYLQDHISVPLTYEVPLSDSLHQLENSTFAALKAVASYLLAGRGILSAPFQNVTSLVPSWLLDDDSRVVAHDPTDLDATVPGNCPDIELMPIANNCTDADIPGKGVFTLLPTLIRPKSRGSVRLATSNPRGRPDVDLGFFDDPDDYVPLRKGIRLALRVAADARARGAPLTDLIVPESTSDQEIDRFIRKNLRDTFHYTSTCRMGSQIHGERPSVVDGYLRVHGVHGLRVCDTSVFPDIVGAHTMAPAVMVAEKCADLIKNAGKT
ncbi:GMC oxidoreductase [Trametes cinnabarina]|uniref:GMC oxidoreductase n=1 Tax=Pycnoporus cinnabarinus TaxID=5643 RepID=A0A060SPW4_PYCCI|nr:GMC oxidoreductase [Trametes cinnabarina]